ESDIPTSSIEYFSSPIRLLILSGKSNITHYPPLNSYYTSTTSRIFKDYLCFCFYYTFPISVYLPHYNIYSITSTLRILSMVSTQPDFFFRFFFNPSICSHKHKTSL